MALREQQTVGLFFSFFSLLAFLFSLSAYGSHSCWRSHLDVKRVRRCSLLLFNGLLNSLSICQQPWSIQSMPSIWGRGGQQQAWQTEKMSQLRLWLPPPPPPLRWWGRGGLYPNCPPSWIVASALCTKQWGPCADSPEKATNDLCL